MQVCVDQQKGWDMGGGINQNTGTAQKSLLHEFLFLSTAIPMSNVCMDVWCIYYTTQLDTQCILPYSSCSLCWIQCVPVEKQRSLSWNDAPLHWFMHDSSCMHTQNTGTVNSTVKLSSQAFEFLSHFCTDLCMNSSCMHTRVTSPWGMQFCRCVI